MSAVSEFTMNFNFKLVYTTIVYNIKISSHASLEDLFCQARSKFAPHINYFKYYIDYVIAGQEKGELAPAVFATYLEYPLWHQFRNWKQISFYVRPINRDINMFVRRNTYIEESSQSVLTAQDPERQDSETRDSDTRDSEGQEPAFENLSIDSEEVYLRDPSLSIQVDTAIFV